MRTTLMAVLGLLCLAPSTWAKGKPQAACDPATSYSAACEQEYQAWQSGELKWRKWMSQFGNYVFVDTTIFMSRHPVRPAPPPWVQAICENGQEGLAPLAVCASYRDSL